MNESANVYAFSLRLIDGRMQSLAAYRGQVLLLVNVASRCGFTPQYKELVALQNRLGDRGLQILGFPCNDFLGQEPDTDEEIFAHCTRTYQLNFPLFSKLKIRGAHAHPLYRWLCHQAPPIHARAGAKLEALLLSLGQKRSVPEDVLWNFEKFVIDRTGRVIGRFGTDIAPDAPALLRVIEQALRQHQQPEMTL